MKATIAAILCTLLTLLNAQAQEVAFETVKLPTRPGEKVGSLDLLASLPAGERRVLPVEYWNGDLSISRYAFVGVKGTEAQELFDPYRDAQGPYFTDVKPLAYKDKVVISIRNVGPGGVDSIWVTDGTTAGTREIANVDPGPYPFIINDTLVLLTEDTAVHFVDLKTGAVTQIANATPSATGYGYLGEFADGRGLFVAAGSVYVTDGTIAGTQIIRNLSSPHFSGFSTISSEKTDPSLLRFFAIRLGASNTFISVVTDGTIAGTQEIPNAAFQLGSDESLYGVQLGSKIIYANTSASQGRELWSLDLVSLQAAILKDINPGSATGYKRSGFYSVNKQHFFVADDGVHGDELWVTDGTSAGTSLARDIAPGAGSGVSPWEFDFKFQPSVGRYFIFSAQPSAVNPSPEGRPYQQELWASDGTPDGTFRLSDSNPNYSAQAVNASGVLAFASSGDFGVKVVEGVSGPAKWSSGMFLRFFDPTLGPPMSSFLMTQASSGQPIKSVNRLSKAGDYFYVDVRSAEGDGRTSEMLVAPRQLCAGSDFKVIPGQCGCGVEELPADSSGGIVQSNADSDGSAVCMTPIGPIFIPVKLSGAISGRLSQQAGQADSVQLTIPAGFQTALQAVTTAPNLDISSAAVRGEGLSVTAASKFKVQHSVSVVVLDKRTKTVKKLPLRKTSKGMLKIKLGRRLTSKQTLTFQYAVGATRGAESLIQTPYRKSGAIKLERR
jgi:ELWxxDGT repeat protein